MSMSTSPSDWLEVDDMMLATVLDVIRVRNEAAEERDRG